MPEAVQPTPSPAAGPQILLVEDEPTITVTLTDDLEEQGYRVVHAGDGRDAIALLAAHRFDAVITDLRLPGADGVQVLRAARRSQPETRVLVITAHAADQLDALAGLGAGTILRKPFRNGSVIDWLRAQCA